jgi:hypothetical protein
MYSDFMARHTGVGIVGFVPADTAPISPYTPLVDGRLIQVKLMVAGDAVTTLIEGVMVRLTSPSFGTLPVHIVVSGNNLRTAPTTNIPIGVQNVDLPVNTGSRIVVEILHITGGTPVTPQIVVIGVFEGQLVG